MRAKTFALIVVSLVLFAPSSAQQNAIIDNCCFVNRSCVTDQEWINGWHAFQRNECPASQPVAQASAPVSAPAGQTIDNCCYVNRSCATDQDWVNGWHAFQRNECPASQPVAQASAPVSAPAGQVIDNCCFVDRQCLSDQEWIAGYQAFQSGQCAPPVPATGGNCCSLGWHCPTDVERAQGYWTYQINQCAGLPQTSGIALTGPVPRIEGSGRFRQHIEATLRFMKSVAPSWYNYVISGLDSIVEEPVHVEPYRDGQTTTCWAFANDRERKARVQTCFMSWIIRHGGPAEFDQVSTAGALGHEACHIHTHEEGKYFASQADEEALCTKMGTGAAVLMASALATGLNPNRGTKYFEKNYMLSLLRQYCAEGYRSDLFCPTAQRLESIWRNVPYAVFPPGAPQW